MQKLSHQEHARRLRMAIRVYSGRLTVRQGALNLGITFPAFAVWTLKNKAKIRIRNPSLKAIKCEFCDWRFINRFALGAHLMGAHPGMKIGNCGRCGAILSEENISNRKADGRLCKACATVANAEWRDQWGSNGKSSAYYRAYHKKIRAEVIMSYGGKCTCCGEKLLEFLTIDHINGGGASHKRAIKQSIYYWLRKKNYPPDFQVLCFNCNCAKGIYSVCPHTWLPS